MWYLILYPASHYYFFPVSNAQNVFLFFTLSRKHGMNLSANSCIGAVLSNPCEESALMIKKWRVHSYFSESIPVLLVISPSCVGAQCGLAGYTQWVAWVSIFAWLWYCARVHHASMNETRNKCVVHYLVLFSLLLLCFALCSSVPYLHARLNLFCYYKLLQMSCSL